MLLVVASAVVGAIAAVEAVVRAVRDPAVLEASRLLRQQVQIRRRQEVPESELRKFKFGSGRHLFLDETEGSLEDLGRPCSALGLRVRVAEYPQELVVVMTAAAAVEQVLERAVDGLVHGFLSLLKRRQEVPITRMRLSLGDRVSDEDVERSN
uniref:Putative secreted protein n=1 Tax=Ixodes ricinus TaxID=34613 RepID=A0A6B0UVY1_IXORI